MPDTKPSTERTDPAPDEPAAQGTTPRTTLPQAAATPSTAPPQAGQAATQSAAPENPIKTLLSTVPGVLTAIAGVLAAITALVTAVSGATWLQPRAAAPAPTAAAIAAPGVAPSPTVTPLVIVVVATPTADASSVPASQEPTRTAPPSVTPLLAMDEDFSAPSAWDGEEDKGYTIRYDQGQAEIEVKAPQITVWDNLPLSRPLSNLTVQVDAWRAANSADGSYGLVVREEQPGYFYLFTVSSDGWYAVLRSAGETYLDLVPWAESDLVLQGEAVNRLRVECHGRQMRFYVNDALIAQVEDLTHTTGQVGLLAGSEDVTPVRMVFDNLMVRELADE